MSDTPRTDALVAKNPDSCDLRSLSQCFNAMLEHARKIERELSAAKSAHADLLGRELGFSEAVEREVAKRLSHGPKCERCAELRDALAGVRGCAAIEALTGSTAWAEVVKELDRILKPSSATSNGE